jgi:hypothetical protein
MGRDDRGFFEEGHASMRTLLERVDKTSRLVLGGTLHKAPKNPAALKEED